jgi:peptidoglycan/xylan/chitin deacetylase (PgdA/CDA1 family)
VGNDQVKSFRVKLEIIKRVANVVSLDDIVTGRMLSEKINIAITFDDGYRGWLNNVCPVLKDLGISATFFVSSGFVGLREEEERVFLRNNLRSTRETTGSITTKELKALGANGFAIGGHTRNHVNLEEIRDLSRLMNEIQKDKEELEKITGVPVNYFAYPFGICTNRYIDLSQILKRCGYKGALTLVPGFSTADTNRYSLHRDLANAAMSSKVFEARILGNYDGVVHVRRMLGLS